MRAKPPGRFYDFLRVLFSSVLALTMRSRLDGREHEPPQGGVLVAVSHLNHLDPVLVSTVLRRRIGWMSRVEFYRACLMRLFLYHSGAFPVNRQGYARPALREALRRLQNGEAVGIFPEGEIMSGNGSVLHGGPVRRGVAWLAAYSGRPVLPVIVLGSEELVRVAPWLPARRGRLWFCVGPLLHAPAGSHTRAGRAAFAAVLEEEFRRLARQTRERYPIPCRFPTPAEPASVPVPVRMGAMAKQETRGGREFA